MKTGYFSKIVIWNESDEITIGMASFDKRVIEAAEWLAQMCSLYGWEASARQVFPRENKGYPHDIHNGDGDKPDERMPF